MEELPDLTSPEVFSLIFIAGWLIIIARYFLVAGIFHMIFYLKGTALERPRKIHPKAYPEGQFKMEIRWSIISSAIFALTFAIMIVMWQYGYTRIYLEINRYSWWYVPMSLALAMLLHETYYYWVHRWMHNPKWFKIIHKVHHDSYIPSPWTAFSFHPYEAALEAIILPLILLVIPLHPAVILIHLVLMTLSSVINHLDIEIYPKSWVRHPVFQWLIGATHHSLHHREFRTNYGLYFTFWDRWMKTESNKYKNML